MASQLNWKKSYNMNNEDLMTCDICLEQFDDETHQPKFLSCHHSFCEPCLVQVANEQNNIECPSCRTMTDLSVSGISGLQTNFYVGYVHGLLKKAGLAEGCLKHSLQPASFFCQKCSQAVCRDCLVLDHKKNEGHMIQDLNTAVALQQEQLTAGITSAQKVLEASLPRLINLKTEVHNLSIARDVTLQDIDAAFKQYAAILEERKEELKKNVLDAYTEKERTISCNALILQNRSDGLKKLIAKSASLLNSGSLSDIVSARHRLTSTLQEISDLTKSKEIGKNNFSFNSKYGEDCYEASVCNLGMIARDSVLPTSFEFGNHDGIVPCLLGKINLTACSCDGEKFAHPMALDVNVSDNVGTMLQSTIKYCAPTQSYSLNFMPQVSGEHYLVPTFHGQLLEEATRMVQIKSNNPTAIYGGLGDGSGMFRSPRALTLDKSGNIYIADTGNRMIQKLDRTGKFLHQFKIDSGSEECSTCDLALMPNEDAIVCMETQVGIGVMGVNPYPSVGNTITIYTTDGALKHKFTDNAMKCAICLATNSHGEIIISDYLVHCLFIYKENGVLLRTVGDSACFNHPSFICIGKDDTIIVTDTNNNNVLLFDNKGRLLRSFGIMGSSKGQLFQPFGVATDNENILVADSGNRRIQVFTMDGTFVSMIESLDKPLDQPRGLGLTCDGHVLVADRDNHCIKKFRYKSSTHSTRIYC